MVLAAEYNRPRPTLRLLLQDSLHRPSGQPDGHDARHATPRQPTGSGTWPAPFVTAKHSLPSVRSRTQVTVGSATAVAASHCPPTRTSV